MDNPCGFSKDQFLAILKQYGPELSAHEIAALGKVSIRQVHCVVHNCDGAWWAIEQFAGEQGWRYRPRITMSKTVKIADPSPKQYNDQGIVKRSPREVGLG